MKKSEKYNLAMMAVVDTHMTAQAKLEIIEMLLADRTIAEYCEKAEEEKNG